MSDNWVGSGGSLNGAWEVPGNWSSGEPTSTTNVNIGFGIAPTSPFTITVAAGSNDVANTVFFAPASSANARGTLSISGTLTLSGSLDGQTALSGATGDITINSGGNLTAAKNILLGGGLLDVVGGVVSDATADVDFEGANGSISAGGRVTAADFAVGVFSHSTVSVSGNNTTINATTLDVGVDKTGVGVLNVTGGAVITASTLFQDLFQSTVSIDASSEIVAGSGTGIAGALLIASAASIGYSTLSANVVDNGVLNVGTGGYAQETLTTINGSLSGTGALSLISTAELVVTGGSAAPSGGIAMAGATLDLRGLAFSSSTVNYTASTGALIVGSQTLNVDKNRTAGDFTIANDGAGGTVITETACYVAGTRIATENGEAAVETLQPGDLVRTAAGKLAPVVWVGRNTLNLAAMDFPEHLAPVRIVAGAFGPALPHRDLLVSPDHALYVDGVLIPAHKLINGATIRQETRLRSVSYVHVELEQHDILLAEGLPAESFLDTGNRNQLDPTSGVRPVRLDTDPEEASLCIYAEHGCAPLMLSGAPVAAAHARLLARAQALGWALSEDPGLGVTTDAGAPIIVPDGARSWLLLLPPGARTVRLQSRTFTAAMYDPASKDGRRLGMALAVECYGAALPDDAYGAGWYGPDEGASWRWTDGDATLHLPEQGRRAVLTLHDVMPVQYWTGPATVHARAA